MQKKNELFWIYSPEVLGYSGEIDYTFLSQVEAS